MSIGRNSRDRNQRESAGDDMLYDVDRSVDEERTLEMEEIEAYHVKKRVERLTNRMNQNEACDTTTIDQP